MKLVALFKIFLGIGIATTGITSAVVFSNIDNVTTPFAKVLTKEAYLAIKQAQNGTNKVNINYGYLPNSTYSFVDLLTEKHNTDQAYMLTIGSQAYAGTNLLLNGLQKKWDDGGNADIEGVQDSLMLKLYDKFFTDSKFSGLNMNFYNYIDVVNTQEYSDAHNLLIKRKNTMGETALSRDESNYWKVLDKNGLWDPTTNNIQPVVKNNAFFDYTPSTTTYYEFRPNDLHDTEYEKIYYRNDDRTRTFIDSMSWMSKYASSNLSTSLSQDGSLLCAKYDSDLAKWSYRSFTSTTEFDKIESTFDTIAEFFVPTTD